MILTGDDLARLLTTLSRRQREVVELLALGLDHLAIASRLVISPNTVRTHIQLAMDKLAVHSRTQLVAYWLRGQATLERLNDAQKVASTTEEES